MPTLLPSGALRARRVSSAASRLPGITSPRFALHGWQRMMQQCRESSCTYLGRSA
ncbi:MAG: hypothetical protein ROD09_20220 [Candidatus Sedimenticola sp. (ex Thyasira tokunagai)]